MPAMQRNILTNAAAISGILRPMSDIKQYRATLSHK